MPPTADSQPFWDGCQAEKLLLQRCSPCEHRFYYARRLCPFCGSNDLSWEPSSGLGTIWTFSEVHVPFPGPEWAGQVPYTVLLIDLAEGPRMLSRWLGRAGSLPRTGQVVRVVFPEIDGRKVPFFAPVAEEIQ
jgi:uncharacterized OB-fold protein